MTRLMNFFGKLYENKNQGKYADFCHYQNEAIKELDYRREKAFAEVYQVNGIF